MSENQEQRSQLLTASRQDLESLETWRGFVSARDVVGAARYREQNRDALRRAEAFDMKARASLDRASAPDPKKFDESQRVASLKDQGLPRLAAHESNYPGAVPVTSAEAEEQGEDEALSKFEQLRTSGQRRAAAHLYVRYGAVIERARARSSKRGAK